MSFSWIELDAMLQWNVRREPSLPPRVVHQLAVSEGTWTVSSRRGTRAPGNKDLLAIIEEPDSESLVVESLKQLVDDIANKSLVARDWMKSRFLPALVRVVALGSDPASHDLSVDSALPGYPPDILLNTLQVIALTEHRKYKSSEPFGGKYLLVRVCAGLAWGVWSAEEISYGVMMQNSVAILRAKTGIREPTLGLVLAQAMSAETLRVSRIELEALSL